MKRVSDTAFGCSFVVLLFVAYMGWCYFEVAMQHRYAPNVTQAMANIPGTRLISSFKSGELINPVSWFWPATTRLVYARPDPSVPNPRFFIMSFGIDDPEDEQPAIMLEDVNCAARNSITYFPEKSGDEGEPALTVLGEPLTAPNGSRFVRYDTGVELSPEELKAFCDTDWSTERRAISGV